MRAITTRIKMPEPLDSSRKKMSPPRETLAVRAGARSRRLGPDFPPGWPAESDGLGVVAMSSSCPEKK
ncbi:MAG TPA: hypothetical protein VHZ97_31950 [Pseudonocardiaceae bacterium]|nr:hypothetical protein [Pseudonocardiaceae bacterium]